MLYNVIKCSLFILLVIEFLVLLLDCVQFRDYGTELMKTMTTFDIFRNGPKQNHQSHQISRQNRCR